MRAQSRRPARSPARPGRSPAGAALLRRRRGQVATGERSQQARGLVEVGDQEIVARTVRLQFGATDSQIVGGTGRQMRGLDRNGSAAVGEYLDRHAMEERVEKLDVRGNSPGPRRGRGIWPPRPVASPRPAATPCGAWINASQVSLQLLSISSQAGATPCANNRVSGSASRRVPTPRPPFEAGPIFALDR
jgi:hypothetical protein